MVPLSKQPRFYLRYLLVAQRQLNQAELTAHQPTRAGAMIRPRLPEPLHDPPFQRVTPPETRGVKLASTISHELPTHLKPALDPPRLRHRRMVVAKHSMGVVADCSQKGQCQRNEGLREGQISRASSGSD